MNNDNNQNLNILDEVNKGATMGMDAIMFVYDKVGDQTFKKVLDGEYKKYKEITKIFKEKYSIFSNIIEKNQEEIKLPKRNLEKNYGKDIIPKVYKALVERTNQRLNKNAQNIEKIALVENYSVASKVKEMYKVLVKQKRFVFNKLFSVNKRSKQEVVTAFSGLLEMSRRKKVETEQEELFGDITVEKRKRA